MLLVMHSRHVDWKDSCQCLDSTFWSQKAFCLHCEVHSALRNPVHWKVSLPTARDRNDFYGPFKPKPVYDCKQDWISQCWILQLLSVAPWAAFLSVALHLSVDVWGHTRAEVLFQIYCQCHVCWRCICTSRLVWSEWEL